MSKRYCIFITALFSAFLAVFLVAGAVCPDQEFSPLENRALQQMPELSAASVLSGQFMSDFETYTTDQFPGRYAWVDLKARTERLMGKQENNGVYFGTEGFLRLSYCYSDAELATALDRMEAFLKTL